MYSKTFSYANKLFLSIVTSKLFHKRNIYSGQTFRYVSISVWNSGDKSLSIIIPPQKFTCFIDHELLIFQFKILPAAPKRKLSVCSCMYL